MKNTSETARETMNNLLICLTFFFLASLTLQPVYAASNGVINVEWPTLPTSTTNYSVLAFVAIGLAMAAIGVAVEEKKRKGGGQIAK